MELDDGLALGLVDPVIARDPAVVLVGLSVALRPVVELPARDPDPGNETRVRELGLRAPLVDEVDDGVSRIVGNPGAGQDSPSSFFSFTISSVTSAITPSFFASFSSSSAIRFSSFFSGLGERAAGSSALAA